MNMQIGRRGCLALSSTPNVTATGWLALSALLRNPDLALEALDLGFNVSINNNVMISFADGLASNSRLKNLELPNFDSTNIASDGWGAVTHILCNQSSILSTYHSNHTLQKLCPSYQYNDVYLPEDLRSLLRINRENSASDAA